MASDAYAQASMAASEAAAEVRRHSSLVNQLLAQGFPDTRHRGTASGIRGMPVPSPATATNPPSRASPLAQSPVRARHKRVQSAGPARPRSTGSGYRAVRGARTRGPGRADFNFTGTTAAARPAKTAEAVRPRTSHGRIRSSATASRQQQSQQSHQSHQSYTPDGDDDMLGQLPDSGARPRVTVSSPVRVRGWGSSVGSVPSAPPSRRSAQGGFTVSGFDALHLSGARQGDGRTAPNPTPTPSRRASSAKAQEMLLHMHVRDPPGFKLPSNSMKEPSRPSSRDVSFLQNAAARAGHAKLGKLAASALRA